jgi:hypothetical protein
MVVKNHLHSSSDVHKSRVEHTKCTKKTVIADVVVVNSVMPAEGVGKV